MSRPAMPRAGGAEVRMMPGLPRLCEALLVAAVVPAVLVVIDWWFPHIAGPVRIILFPGFAPSMWVVALALILTPWAVSASLRRGRAT
jgi:hypothetical protein